MSLLPSLLDSKKLVIKIGSSLVVENNKFNSKRLESLIKDVSFLQKKKIKILIVASGAVSLGKRYLGIKNNKVLKINEKQACAACGQSLLMNSFLKIFKDLKIAQILLTYSETEHRRKNLNARETINTLLDSNVIPIINENDTIATEELKFGDNDRLAARVAQIVDADNLILLSDVDGLYDENPSKFKKAKLIYIVKNIDNDIKKMAKSDTNLYGSGGMKTKIEAAQMAMNFGCNTLICSGEKSRPIIRIIKKKKNLGTWFIAKKSKKSSFKKWLAGSPKILGKIIIDGGACKALKNGSSLLPSGVKSMKGNFFRGDLVGVFNEKKQALGKGLISYDIIEAKLIIGKKTSEIESILGYVGREELIHRDNFILNESILIKK